MWYGESKGDMYLAEQQAEKNFASVMSNAATNSYTHTRQPSVHSLSHWLHQLLTKRTRHNQRTVATLHQVRLLGIRNMVFQLATAV